MNQPEPKTIIPVKISAPAPKDGEEVYQVQDAPPIVVGPGDIVEIIITSPEGFSVYFPFVGHFDAQVFEAVKNPAWAIEKLEMEMEATEGGSKKSSDDSVWAVRMTRISEVCEKEPKDFPYCIYSKNLKTFAVGNSPPTMTLDP